MATSTTDGPITRIETFATLPLFFGVVALRVFDYALPVVLADSGVAFADVGGLLVAGQVCTRYPTRCVVSLVCLLLMCVRCRICCFAPPTSDVFAPVHHAGGRRGVPPPTRD